MNFIDFFQIIFFQEIYLFLQIIGLTNGLKPFVANFIESGAYDLALNNLFFEI